MSNNHEELPESWATITLGEAVSTIAINDKKIPQKEYLTKGPYPVLDQGQDYIGGYTDRKENLIASEMPVIVFGDHTRIIKYVNQPFAPGADGVKVLKPKPFYDAKLFAYFARHIATHLTNNGYARHYQHLTKSTIPIPPLLEQRRIVAKIEELFSELDKGIESLKTAREQIKVYRQALLKHAFEGKLTAEWREEHKHRLESAEGLLHGIKTERAERYQQQLAEWEAAGKQGSKPRAPKELIPLTSEELAGLPELPEGWQWEKLNNITFLITDGKHGDCLDQENSGYYFVSAKDIFAGRINYENARQITKEDFEEVNRRTDLKVNDVVITNAGTIGRIAIAADDPITSKITFQKSVAVIKKPNHLIVSKYLAYYLEKDVEKIKLASKGTAQKNLLLGTMSEINIPICCVDEQKKIVQELESRLSTLDQLDQTITQSFQQAEAMRQSILKKAFSGQLVPQDPNDEPASALLARIKAEKAAPKAVQSSIFGNNNL